MADIAVMVQALTFIEAHLREPIGVAEMAEAVCYSLYYFCRTFHEITHHTPYDYLMRRRITEAARDLHARDVKIINVAFAYQFNDPATFTRAFKRVMGEPPSAWRQHGAGFRQLMPRLTEAHLRHIAEGGPWRPAEEHNARLDLVGVMALQADAPGKATAWAWLRRELQEASPGAAYGITYAEDACVVAIAAPPALATGRALVVKTLPPGDYVRFTHRGDATTVPLTLDYAYHTWLPQSRYRLAQTWYAERWEAGHNAPNGPRDILIPLTCAEG